MMFHVEHCMLHNCQHACEALFTAHLPSAHRIVPDMLMAFMFHVEHRALQLELDYEASRRSFPQSGEARSWHLRAAQHPEMHGQDLLPYWASYLQRVKNVPPVCGCST